MFVGLTGFGLVRCGSGVMSGSVARTALPPEVPGHGTGRGSVSASSGVGKTLASVPISNNNGCIVTQWGH